MINQPYSESLSSCNCLDIASLSIINHQINQPALLLGRDHDASCFWPRRHFRLGRCPMRRPRWCLGPHCSQKPREATANFLPLMSVDADQLVNWSLFRIFTNKHVFCSFVSPKIRGSHTYRLLPCALGWWFGCWHPKFIAAWSYLSVALEYPQGHVGAGGWAWGCSMASMVATSISHLQYQYIN